MKSRRRVLEETVIERARDLRATRTGIADLDEALDDLDRYIEAISDARGAFVPGSSTSEQAAIMSRLTVGSVRRRIVDEIRSVGLQSGLIGLTDDELERRLHKPHTTVSSARNWLCHAGWLMDSGHTRVTTNRRDASVWKLTPAAISEVQAPEWVERSKP